MSEPDPPRETWDEDTYQHLRLTRHGFAAVVTLDRPDLHNAFNERLIGEIQRAFERLSEAEDIRAVVLQGAGKSFCAGADLNWMRASLDFTHDENIADALKLSDMLRAIDACRHPVIGRVHGAALGGGAGLTAVCDIAIAAEGTRFGFTEARLGIAPAVISPVRRAEDRPVACPRALPDRRALRRAARARPSGWSIRSSRSTIWMRR